MSANSPSPPTAAETGQYNEVFLYWNDSRWTVWVHYTYAWDKAYKVMHRWGHSSGNWIPLNKLVQGWLFDV